MTTITNNMSKNSGSIQNTSQDISHLTLSDSQGTVVIVGIFFIFSILLFLLFNLMKTYINKSCLKCKYLKKCEEDIKNIKKDMMLNDMIDSEILKTIAEDVATVKKEMLKHGTSRNIHN